MVQGHQAYERSDCMRINPFVWLILTISLTACTVGPDYVRPKVSVPQQFKEAAKGWKVANPQENCDRGEWWRVFNDPVLNDLENKLNVANQNIAVAFAQYKQARALVCAARAAYYPTVTSSAGVTKEQLASGPSANTSSTQTSATGTSISSGTTSLNRRPSIVALTLEATWEPDLWGSVRRSVEAATAGAQASKDQFALVKLSSQASLAQYYFELRSIDVNQKLLDESVEKYKKLLKITHNRYNAGTASQADILQIKSQLEAQQALAIDNGINRAQYEHAIAVLAGENPSCFTLKPLYSRVVVPSIPLEVPSSLLERRPDIAQAERLMAQANAKIGVAVAAYYPTLTLSGIGGYSGSSLSHLFSAPNQFWILAALLSETLFDGGLREANVLFAKAGYEESVATYRQTVLAAFQDVEDNLASLRILDAEAKVQLEATQTAQKSLTITTNEYKAGTVGTLEVLNAEITDLTAEMNLNNVQYRQMTSAVGLIKALGGGWQADASPQSPCQDKSEPNKQTCHVP